MAMNLGLQSMRLAPAYLDGHVMILNDVGGPENYAKLISFGELPSNYSGLPAYIPGEGLLVLEAQQRVLSFLIICCQHLLESVSVHTLIPSWTLELPLPPPLPERQPGSFESLLRVETTEAPYHLPRETDFDRIESILGGALSAAIDHIWMLREDPYYFMQILAEIEDHQPETGQTAAGKTSESDPSLPTNPRGLISGYRTMASEMYYRLELFAELHKQSQLLSHLHKKHAATLRPSQVLPGEFGHAMARFLFYAHRTLSYLLRTFMYNVIMSPPWRRFFNLELSDASPGSDAFTKAMIMPVDDAFEFTRMPGVGMDEMQTRTFSLLYALGSCFNSTALLRYFQPVEELAEFFECHKPDACNLVTDRVAKMIGEVAVVSHCIVQIYYFLPWARCFDKMTNGMNNVLTNELDQRKGWTTFKDVD